MISRLCNQCGHSLRDHAPRALAKQDLEPEERNRALLKDTYPCWYRDECVCNDFTWRRGEFFESYAEHESLNLQDDPGLRLVRDAYRDLSVDKEWTEFNGRGFKWWGHQLMQYVWADEPAEERGELITAVHAETGILRDISSEHARALVALMNTMATLNAYVFDPKRRTLNMRCSVYVHPQNEEWLSKLFGLAAALQAAEAQAKIDNGLAETLAAAPATSAHPSSGLRATRDEMLEVGHWVARTGEDASISYSAADVAEAHELLEGTWPLAFVGESDGSFVGEIPFDGEFGDSAENATHAEAVLEAARRRAVDASDLLRGLWFSSKGLDSRRAATGAPARSSGLRSALLQVLSAERHPEFGHGALLRLNLPLFFDEREECLALASEMNLAESSYWTGVHQIGSWCSSPQNNLAHVAFLPAYSKSASWLVNLMLSSNVRVDWARWYLGERSTYPYSEAPRPS